MINDIKLNPLLVLLIIFFFHFFIGLILEKLSKPKVFAHIVNFILLVSIFFFTLGVKDTADAPMFKWFYENDWTKVDPMFIFLSRIMNSFGYDYYAFYQLHVIIYTFAYYYFISRFTNNIFYVFLPFIILYYVPYVNQIRYYLAFPFFLLSIHYILHKKNLTLAVLCALFALLSHIGIILLYGFIPLYHFMSTKKFFKTVFVLSGVAFIVMMILFQLGIAQQIEHFGNYFNEEMTSSVAGGMFNALPYFIYIIYLWMIDKKYRNENPDFNEDKIYTLLSKLTFFTIIFIPASFFVQILGHRYVFPFIIIWMIFYLYLMRNKATKRKLINFFLMGVVHISVGICIYILPELLLGESNFEAELVLSLKSVSYLKFIFK
ncbi:EpsG family protein [Chryseobacterium lacus]|nr:EpsG family protein [Chryseobacterium lacus]